MSEVARKSEGENQTRKRRPRGRPKGLRISVRQSEQITAICTRLGLPDTLLTFRDVAAALSQRAGFTVSLGTVHRYAKGEYPKRPELRALFRLPKIAHVPACAECGGVHLRRSCPNKAKATRKPRRRATLRTERLLTWAVLALLHGANR